MSYEGHDEILCSNGHLSCFDCHEEEQFNPDWFCRCGAKMVWWTAVDETDGCDEETGQCPGEVDLEVAVEAKYCTCQCGNMHTVQEETYKIPPKGIGRHVK
jgi:hypothetical protein